MSENISKRPQWRRISIEPKYEQSMKQILDNIAGRRRKMYKSTTYYPNRVQFIVKVKADEIVLMKLTFPLLSNEKLILI